MLPVSPARNSSIICLAPATKSTGVPPINGRVSGRECCNGPIVNDPGGIVTFAGRISGSGGFVINGGSDAASTSGFELPASLTNNTVVFPSDYGEVILDSASTFTGRL